MKKNLWLVLIALSLLGLVLAPRQAHSATLIRRSWAPTTPVSKVRPGFPVALPSPKIPIRPGLPPLDRPKIEFPGPKMPVLPARPVKIQPAAALQDALKTLPLAAMARRKLGVGEGTVDAEALHGLFDNGAVQALAPEPVTIQPVPEEPLGTPEGEGESTLPEQDLEGELGLRPPR